MLASASQHRQLTRVHKFGHLAVPALVFVGFILMLSGLGMWLIGFLEPHPEDLTSTFLELGSFVLFGAAACLLDLDDKRERAENFAIDGDKRSSDAGN